MQPTIHHTDPRHRHLTRSPLAVLAIALALIAGVVLTTAVPASATTATSVTVDRYGTRLGTTVILDASRRIKIQVGDTRLPDGRADYVSAGMGTRVVSNEATATPTSSLYHLSTGLKPGKLYWVQVYAQESNGSWTQVVRNRAAMTKSRLVKVYFDKVAVFRDGDPMGCGELSFRLEVDHRWGQADHYNSSEYSMCDVRTYTMNWSAPWVTQNGSSLSVQAAVQDDDTPSGQLCVSGWGGCGNYGEAAKTLSLPNENNDGYVKSFQLTISDIAGNSPGVTWYGRYSVVYG